MILFEPDTYTDGLVTRAYMNGRHVATCVRDGNACSVRWGHLDHPTPGYVERFASLNEARAAVEAWVAGLDIVPWDENGKPYPSDG